MGVFFDLKISSLSISIVDPPKILPDFNEKIRLIRGENTSITCTVIGSPDRLQLYWMDDQSIISNISKLHLDTGKAQFNEMNFTCVSKNPFGRDSRSIFVQIIGEIVTRKKNY